MTPCQPVNLQELDPARVVFTLRCGRREYAGWHAVRRDGEVGILPGSSGPRLSRASVDALRVPVFVAWTLGGVAKWPE